MSVKDRVTGCLKHCQQCGKRFHTFDRHQKYCNSKCRMAVVNINRTARRAALREELQPKRGRPKQLENQDVTPAKKLSAPGARVMTQPWSLFRYSTGTVVGRVKVDEGVSLIRVNLDNGRLYDFPLEHIDLIED